MAHAGEDVHQLAFAGGGVADPVGGDQRKMEARGEIRRSLIAALLFTETMALKLDIDVVCAEDADELMSQPLPLVAAL